MRQLNFKKDWKEDKAWVDLFEPAIKKICAEVFIHAAPKRIDMEEATDLLVLEIKPITIACRVRRYKYYPDFSDEFTMRRSRPSGKKSEISKIIEGWGDYYFYGFSNKFEDGSGFESYTIFDLRIFRRELILHGYKKHLKFSRQNNKNGSSDFLAFKLNCFPEDFFIKEA